MSSGEMIALVCVLCLVPLWAAGSIIMFALGAVHCGRMMDPYYGAGGSGGERGHCPMDPRGPRDDRGDEERQGGRPGHHEADWWPQFERELGRYVEEQEPCPSGPGATSTEPGSGTRGTPARA
ncbi:MAG: hypothetical protein ACTHQQ_02095 [Solirubrobacteraceae bacterium]